MQERSPTVRTGHYFWIAVLLLFMSCGVVAGIAAAAPGQAKGSGAARPANAPAGKTAGAGSSARPAGESSPVARASGSGDPIVARVNNDVITYKALAEECVARKGPEVLETMISKLLVVQACQEKGLKVTAQEIDEEIGRTAERLRMTREQYLKVLQNERGISYERYKDDIVWPGLALRKLATPLVQVTEQEIEHGFEAHFGEKVQCRWIMFDDQQNAIQVWNELRNSAQDGKCELAEFERQVTRWSSDVGTRSIGGQIQPIAHHTSPMFRELEKAAFALKENGEISRILRLGESYVILYREARIPPSAVKLEDVRAQVEAEIYDAKLRDQIGGIFDELKRTASIENLLTGDVTSPDQGPAGSDKPGKTKGGPARVGSTKDAPKKSQPTIRK